MCLILLAWQAHPDYPLVLAANRDEFFNRPTAPARFWPESPALLAGRDLQGGGTWLGITRNGRFAALTNYREPSPAIQANPTMPTRGLLVSDFLQSALSAPDYFASIATKAPEYRAFSLICGTLSEGLWYASNRNGTSEPMTARPIPPGIHGLSNNLLNVAWPKVSRGINALRHALPELPDTRPCAQLLHDTQLAADDCLPHTGISRTWEKQLSALFIRAPHYGTRSSTLLTCNQDGIVTFDEYSYAPDACITAPITPQARHRYRFNLFTGYDTF